MKATVTVEYVCVCGEGGWRGKVYLANLAGNGLGHGGARCAGQGSTVKVLVGKLHTLHVLLHHNEHRHSQITC